MLLVLLLLLLLLLLEARWFVICITIVIVVTPAAFVTVPALIVTDVRTFAAIVTLIPIGVNYVVVVAGTTNITLITLL